MDTARVTGHIDEKLAADGHLSPVCRCSNCRKRGALSERKGSEQSIADSREADERLGSSHDCSAKSKEVSPGAVGTPEGESLSAAGRFQPAAARPMAVAASERSLSVTHPDIAAELIEELSGCSAVDVHPGSRKVALFRCPKDPEHIYAARIRARTLPEGRQGCPVCYAETNKNMLVDLNQYPAAKSMFACGWKNTGFVQEALPIRHKVFWVCRTIGRHFWYESFLSLAVRNFLCPFCSEDAVFKLACPDAEEEFGAGNDDAYQPRQVNSQRCSKENGCSVPPSRSFLSSKPRFKTQLFAVAAFIGLVLALLFSRPVSAQTLSAPTFSQPEGIYKYIQVSLSGPSGATIHYTLDGTDPDQFSPKYGPAILFTSSTVWKAIAMETGYTNSPIAKSYYKIEPNLDLIQTTNLKLWIQSDPNFITSSSGDVSAVTDISQSSNSPTQTSGSNQPTLVSGDWNGFSAITTDSSKFLNLPTDFSSMAGTSVFVVLKPNNTGNGDVIDLGNGSASDNITLSTSGADAVFTVYNGSSSSSITASSALTTGQYQLLEAVQDNSGNGKIFVNGTQVQTGSLNNPNSVSRTVNHIGCDNSGSANFFEGGILEMLVYTAPLTDSARQQLEQFLIQKYQLKQTTPAAPVMSVGGGTLSAPAQVAIAAQGDAELHLTVDGSTPSTTSPVYQGPLNISYTTTVKAIAVKNGLSSSVTSNTYTLDSTQFPAPGSDTRPLQIYTNTPAVAPAPY